MQCSILIYIVDTCHSYTYLIVFNSGSSCFSHIYWNIFCISKQAFRKKILHSIIFQSFTWTWVICVLLTILDSRHRLLLFHFMAHFIYLHILFLIKFHSPPCCDSFVFFYEIHPLSSRVAFTLHSELNHIYPLSCRVSYLFFPLASRVSSVLPMSNIKSNRI